MEADVTAFNPQNPVVPQGVVVPSIGSVRINLPVELSYQSQPLPPHAKLVSTIHSILTICPGFKPPDDHGDPDTFDADLSLL